MDFSSINSSALPYKSFNQKEQFQKNREFFWPTNGFCYGLVHAWLHCQYLKCDFQTWLENERNSFGVEMLQYLVSVTDSQKQEGIVENEFRFKQYALEVEVGRHIVLPEEQYTVLENCYDPAIFLQSRLGLYVLTLATANLSTMKIMPHGVAHSIAIIMSPGANHSIQCHVFDPNYGEYYFSAQHLLKGIAGRVWPYVTDGCNTFSFTQLHRL